MTIHDTPNRDRDAVDVASGVPTDRVRWGPIVAGTFAALTAMAVLTTLGAAVGLSAYDPGDNPRAYAIGSGIWGVLSMLVSFAFGGWLAARSSAVRGHDNGLLNGFMVAGFGIPLTMFLLGSAATLMGHAAVNNNRDAQSSNNAVQASATLGGGSDRSIGSQVDAATGGAGSAGMAGQRPTEDQRRAASRSAWSTLAALVLAIAAASTAGYVGARDDRHHVRTAGAAGSDYGSTSAGRTL